MTTQPKNYSHRSPLEAKALELLDLDRNGIEWTPNMAALAMVWRAQWSAAMRFEKIQKLAAVMGDYRSEDLDPTWLKAELAKMVRAKVLRSYTKQGQYLYEVNF